MRRYKIAERPDRLLLSSALLLDTFEKRITAIVRVEYGWFDITVSLIRRSNKKLIIEGYLVGGYVYGSYDIDREKESTYIITIEPYPWDESSGELKEKNKSYIEIED
ncbi:MAG: hypothetical protein WAV31_01290 [Candidatus Moraniibacteriota bacterium]